MDKANNALADNAVLIIEVNDLRKELKLCYHQISGYRFELKKQMGSESFDLFADALSPLEIKVLHENKVEERDADERKIPSSPIIPKSVKTTRIRKKKNL